MSITQSNLKKASAFFTILLTLFLVARTLTASECQVEFKSENQTSLTNAEIEREIKQYLINNSLLPILADNRMKYDIVNVFEDYLNTVYVVGFLDDGGEEGWIFASFTIQQDSFGYIAELKYLAVDTPPSLPLYEYVCSTAQSFLSKSLSQYHVFIRGVENSDSEETGQQWTFFNEQERVDLLVFFKDDGYDGTDYNVMPLPSEESSVLNSLFRTISSLLGF